jgi:two-component system, NarL family, invasion response regulator UvrY
MMNTMDEVEVLIVDDQEPYRAALRALFSRMREFRLVGEARSGEEAVLLADQLHPGLVMMDISMEGIGGIAATSSITAHDPDVLVVLVSTYAANELPRPAHSCGAAAYVEKAELSAQAVRRIWSDRGDPTWQRD